MSSSQLRLYLLKISAHVRDIGVSACATFVVHGNFPDLKPATLTIDTHESAHGVSVGTTCLYGHRPKGRGETSTWRPAGPRHQLDDTKHLLRAIAVGISALNI